MSNAPSAHTLQRFISIVGSAYALPPGEDQAPYLKEWRDLYTGNTPLVLRPGTVGEVAEIVKVAAETGTALVPQGGNTGLVGGQTPTTLGNEVLISLSRMNKIRDLDVEGDTITVEAGVILDHVHKAVEAAGRMVPLTLASQGSCTIGGNISSNAGGTAVLAYGNMRDLVLGLEVVLPDGRIWHGLRRLKKDNTGYDLKHLFIGAEGTLGIVTAAVLKLFPQPKGREVALVLVRSAADALALLKIARARAGGQLTAFELMSPAAFGFTLKHSPQIVPPFGTTTGWVVLIEVVSQLEGDFAKAALESLLAEALESEVAVDAILAQSLTQGANFWALRHRMSEVQKYEGGSIKHDVSVPVAKLPAFLAEATAAAEGCIPGCRPVPFGHMGDGNIHFNVSQPVGMDKQTYLDRWDEMNAAVHGVVARFNGSIAAEHGVGRLKWHLLEQVKDPVELAMMRAVKATLDPKGIMNPGREL